jgi:hypothetical protein
MPAGIARGMYIKITLPRIIPISEYVNTRSAAMIFTSGGIDARIKPKEK